MQGIFRIFYSTTYTVVFLILVLLLAVTPGDTIYQSIRDSQLQNVFIIAGAYILAGLLVLFFYGSRLYTSRTVLAAIPKSYVPIEVGDVGPKVQRMIAKQLNRNALIAWNLRPRDLQAEIEHAKASMGTRLDIIKDLPANYKDDEINQLLRGSRLLFDPYKPPWGNIEHQGWSSSICEDFPNLQFSKVINELPHLIEAKAVTLAPDAQQITHMFDDFTEQYVPDRRLFGVLQRSASMDLRDYLVQLIHLEVITDENAAVKFVAQYESAHYSDEGLTESQFRDLMASFSSVLSNMVEIKQSIILQRPEDDGEIVKGSNLMRDFLSEDSTDSQRMPILTQNHESSSGTCGGEIGANTAGKNVMQEANKSVSDMKTAPLASKLSNSPSKSQTFLRNTDRSRSTSLSAVSINSHQSVIRHNMSVQYS